MSLMRWGGGNDQDMVSIMPAKKQKPATQSKTRKPLGVQVRGSDEWKAWIEEAALHSRMSVSGFVDIAVVRFAKEQGFTKPPPER